MRSKSVLAVILAALCIASMSAARPAAAATGGDPPTFQAIATDCTVLALGIEEVDEAGILHIRGLVLGGFIESDHELVAGTSEVEINADINTATGNGQVWVNLILTPAAVEGTWVAPGAGPAAPRAPLVHRGTGTGALAGLRIQFRTTLLAEHPGVPPCADPLNVFEFRGVILPLPGGYPPEVEETVASLTGVSVEHNLFLPTVIR